MVAIYWRPLDLRLLQTSKFGLRLDVYGAFFLSKFKLLVVFTDDLRFSDSTFVLFTTDSLYPSSTFVLFNLDSRFLSSTFVLFSRNVRFIQA